MPTDLEFESDGRRLKAVLMRPEVARPQAPGVLVIHEIFGLNDDIKAVAQRFAQAGYVALAVDLFSAESRALCMARMFSGIFLNSLEHQGVRDTRRALEVLSQQPGVDAQRLGAVGFCMGGSLALALACTGDQVKAVAPYYGFNPRSPEALARSCPVVGSYPENDVTRKEGVALERELQQAGVVHDVKVYPATRHSFANAGFAFDGLASVDAWNRVMAFFDEHVLGQAPR